MFPESEIGGWKWGCCRGWPGEGPHGADPGQERRLGKSEGDKAGGPVLWPRALAVRCYSRTVTEKATRPNLHSRILIYLPKPGVRGSMRDLPSSLQDVGSLLAV